MYNPLVAICMPSYNRAHVIQHAIRSIIDQDYKNWRLIIVDDGSEDGTKRIVDNFAHPRIIYKKIEHSGYVSRVRNEANAIAKEIGAEICIVQDSDDISLPDRISSIVEAFEQNLDADVIYHGYYMRFFDPYHNAHSYQLRATQPYSKEHLLREQYIPGQIAYTTKAIMDIGGYTPEIRCCDDYDILLKLALENKKFVPIYKNLYIYPDSADSINVSGEADGSRKRDVEIILKMLKEKYNIQAIAGLVKNTIGGDLISREIVR